MKFDIYAHKMSYYMTKMGDDTVLISPTETYTVLQYNNSTFIMSYGMTKYELLLQQSEAYPQEFATTIKQLTAGVGSNSPKRLISINKLHDQAKNEMFTKNLSTDAYNVFDMFISMNKKQPNPAKGLLEFNDYVKKLNEIEDVLGVELDKDQIKELIKLGAIDNPELDYLVSAFIELMKQLKDQGILATIQDPSLMIKSYDEGKAK